MTRRDNMLPRKAVIEFQQIYKDIYKKEITFEEAEVLAQVTLLAHKAVYKSIRKEWDKSSDGKAQRLSSVSQK